MRPNAAIKRTSHLMAHYNIDVSGWPRASQGGEKNDTHNNHAFADRPRNTRNTDLCRRT